jgi:hypothetical protein
LRVIIINDGVITNHTYLKMNTLQIDWCAKISEESRG